MKKILILVLLLLLNFTISFSQEVPNIFLKNLDGKSVSITDLIDSNNVNVLSFWATWCVPCINELDAISDVYEDWQDETNVKIIAISTDDSRNKKKN